MEVRENQGLIRSFRADKWAYNFRYIAAVAQLAQSQNHSRRRGQSVHRRLHDCNVAGDRDVVQTGGGHEYILRTRHLGLRIRRGMPALCRDRPNPPSCRMHVWADRDGRGPEIPARQTKMETGEIWLRTGAQASLCAGAQYGMRNMHRTMRARSTFRRKSDRSSVARRFSRTVAIRTKESCW
jgi:hypothetical protein